MYWISIWSEDCGVKRLKIKLKFRLDSDIFFYLLVYRLDVGILGIFILGGIFGFFFLDVLVILFEFFS